MIRTELNEEELRRHEVLSRVGRKELPLREAAGLLRVELRAGQALAQAIPGGGRDGPAAWQHGETVEPGEAGGVAGAGPGAGAGEVWRGRGGWIRADAGGRAPGERPRDPDRCDHTTEVDADGGALEAAAQAQVAETPTGAEGAFRGAAAAGREPSQVAGRARAEGVSDEPGGRRDRGGAMPVRGGGDDLGGGGPAGALGAVLRGAAGTVHGLVDGVLAEGDGAGAAGRGGAGDTIRNDVRKAGHRDHRGGLGPSEGARGKGERHPPGSLDQEAATARDQRVRGGEPVPGERVPAGA